MPIRPSAHAAALVVLAGSAQALAAGPFPVSIELSALDGTDGFVLNGIDASDRSGVSVSSAGDVNGDGVDDLIVGASSADPNGGPTRARATWCSAARRRRGRALELSALDGTNGFALNGIARATTQRRLRLRRRGRERRRHRRPDRRGLPRRSERPGLARARATWCSARAGFARASLDLSALDGSERLRAERGRGERLLGRRRRRRRRRQRRRLRRPDRRRPRRRSERQTCSGQSYVVFGASSGFAASLDLSALDGTQRLRAERGRGGRLLGPRRRRRRRRQRRRLRRPDRRRGTAPIRTATFRARATWCSAPAAASRASLELSALDGTNGFALNGVAADDSRAAPSRAPAT
jgi:hypothetical protein